MPNQALLLPPGTMPYAAKIGAKRITRPRKFEGPELGELGRVQPGVTCASVVQVENGDWWSRERVWTLLP